VNNLPRVVPSGGTAGNRTRNLSITRSVVIFGPGNGSPMATNVVVVAAVVGVLA